MVSLAATPPSERENNPESFSCPPSRVAGNRLKLVFFSLHRSFVRLVLKLRPDQLQYTSIMDGLALLASVQQVTRTTFFPERRRCEGAE